MNLFTKIKGFILTSIFIIPCAIRCIFLIIINENQREKPTVTTFTNFIKSISFILKFIAYLVFSVFLFRVLVMSTFADPASEANERFPDTVELTEKQVQDFNIIKTDTVIQFVEVVTQDQANTVALILDQLSNTVEGERPDLRLLDLDDFVKNLEMAIESHWYLFEGVGSYSSTKLLQTSLGYNVERYLDKEGRSKISNYPIQRGLRELAEEIRYQNGGN